MSEDKCICNSRDIKCMLNIEVMQQHLQKSKTVAECLSNIAYVI